MKNFKTILCNIFKKKVIFQLDLRNNSKNVCCNSEQCNKKIEIILSKKIKILSFTIQAYIYFKNYKLFCNFVDFPAKN